MNTNADLYQLWTDFLETWPPERVRRMALEEYTNANKDDAFIYWIEARLQDLGSIWGGSAFKFGIYHRADTQAKPSTHTHVFGETYAWWKKLGRTPEEAFATVRERLVEVVEAAQTGNLARIEAVDLAPTLKWKVAFLYQGREHPTIIPIYRKEALFHHYKAVESTAKLGTTPYHVMHVTLSELHRELGDVFQISKSLYQEYERAQTLGSHAWAVPLAWFLESDAISRLCSETEVQAEDIDSFLDSLLASGELAEGDEMALLDGERVCALATLTSVEPGQFAWTQIPVDLPSNLTVNPTSEIRQLTPAERNDIWGRAPATANGRQETERVPRYWKIAPGPGAVCWPVWREKGIASVGWPALGDLTGVAKEEFDRRTEAGMAEYGYTVGVSQVWTFCSIRPGDRVVANRGKSAVMGIGTVVSGYRFVPDAQRVEGEPYSHQVEVRWDDTEPRAIEPRQGWQRTILELSREDFERIVSGEPDPAKAPAAPCRPENVILYGPPGTGKTFSTLRRALELILGRERVASLSQDAVVTLFRQQQQAGRIEFVTFHQAYGYEEFVEGLRPVLGTDGGGEMRYELHAGAFKRIALRAAAEGLRERPTEPSFDELWTSLVDAVQADEDRLTTSFQGRPYVLRLTSERNLAAHPCELDEDGSLASVGEEFQIASKTNTRLVWEHRRELGPKPEDVTSPKTLELFKRERGGRGGHHFTAIWIAYKELWELSRSGAAHRPELTSVADRVQEALDRPVQGTVDFEFSAASPHYVLIVDEINRGNVSKILGELITLLEADKRLGASAELKLPLAYSPEHRFAVPPNLHVLGTMNTADRSIALMDVALRRRFTFEELMPDSNVIRKILLTQGTPSALIDLVVDLFETLNARIRFLYDRDHQLGHAYFLGITSLDDLRQVFVDRVIPLLQEYFYGAWDKICMVLGCPVDESGRAQRGAPAAQGGTYSAPIVRVTLFEEAATLGFDHEEYEDRLDFQVLPPFAHDAMTIEDLLLTFVNVLNLDPAEQRDRLETLQGALGTGFDGESA